MRDFSVQAILSASVLSFASCTSSLAGAILTPCFSEFAITAGHQITKATAMEFSPDGKLYVLQQAGGIQVYEGAGASVWVQRQSNFLANTPIPVYPGIEGGLLGIAFDPGFVKNRFVYLHYSTIVPMPHARLIRVTANDNGDLALADSVVSLIDFNASGTVHMGGAIHFGPDGMLYVAVGDRANSANSQSISTLFGKMLRLNPDPDNLIPSDNPTAMSGISGETSGINKLIWAAGLRNPFTFAIHPQNGTMCINDVGLSKWEEINFGTPGANFAWGIIDGPFDSQANASLTPPLISYPHPNSNGQSDPPLLGFTGSAIAGGVFYSTPNLTFPPEFHDAYFFCDWGADWLKWYQPQVHAVHNFAWFVNSPVDLRVGADGALYYLTYQPGAVYRVQAVTPWPCLADTTQDGEVGAPDLFTVIDHWGEFGLPGVVTGDIAPDCGNGIVDVDDLLALINAWGPCD